MDKLKFLAEGEQPVNPSQLGRDALKGLFKNEKCPDEGDYALIFDSTINLEDDGIVKPEGKSPLIMKAKNEENIVLKFMGKDSTSGGWDFQLKDESKTLRLSPSEVELSGLLELNGILKANDLNFHSQSFWLGSIPSIVHFDNLGQFKDFGYSVDICDNFCIIGCSGIAFIYEKDVALENQWLKIASLVIPQPYKSSDSFGQIVAISDKYAIVGARSLGVLFVYSKDKDNNWSFKDEDVIKILSPEGISDFVRSIDMSNEYIIVGCGHKILGMPFGAVCIFKNIDGESNWTNVGILYDPSSLPYPNFGNSVGIFVDYAIVSGNGEAYLFYKTENQDGDGQNVEVWSLDDRKIVGESESFGSKVAISGDYIVVSEPDFDEKKGVIHVYNSQYSSSEYHFCLKNPDAEKIRRFGHLCNICGNNIIVCGENSTSAYIYIREESLENQWNFAFEILLESTPKSCNLSGEYFCRSLAIANTVSILGTFDNNTFFIFQNSNRLNSITKDIYKKLLHNKSTYTGHSISKNIEPSLASVFEFNFGNESSKRVGIIKINKLSNSELWISGMDKKIPIAIKEEKSIDAVYCEHINSIIFINNKGDVFNFNPETESGAKLGEHPNAYKIFYEYFTSGPKIITIGPDSVMIWPLTDAGTFGQSETIPSTI